MVPEVISVYRVDVLVALHQLELGGELVLQLEKEPVEEDVPLSQLEPVFLGLGEGGL